MTLQKCHYEKYSSDKWDEITNTGPLIFYNPVIHLLAPSFKFYLQNTWTMYKALILLVLHTVQENTSVALRVIPKLVQNVDVFTI